MIKKFSKIISVVLSIIMVVMLAVPAFAAPQLLTSKYPIVYFRGNSESIIDEDGNVVYDFDVDGETIAAIAKKVLPLLATGMITNDFDEYYKVFGEEMAKVYDKVMLDQDGNPRYGTGITQEQKDRNKWEMSTDRGKNGRYTINYYDFANDWRLDPLATVDDVKEYIDGILKVTGKDKVCLACKCLGGDLILAYLAKYGTENIHAVCFGSTVAFGGNLANDTFSGHMNVDPDELTRFVNDDYIRKELPDEYKVIYEFINKTMELANATGITKGLTDAFMKTLYAKLYKGLVHSLATSTYATWPGYWTMVSADRYAEARDLVFGPIGSEKRTYYAGLVEKLDNYDVQVRQRIPELLKMAEADGVNICIVSKYGFQMPPVLESADEQGDVWVTTGFSSLGATSSKIGKTLPEDYRQSRIDAGYEKYLSPDNQIDASTCVFPEYTWFIKGAVHNDWSIEEDNIITRVCDSDVQLTVDTMEGKPQFLVYDRATDTVAPMTKDNCNTETYEVDAPKPSKKQNIFNTLKIFFEWLKQAFSFLTSIFKK